MNESKQDIFDRIMQLPGLRRFFCLYKKNKQILLYIFFGGCTTVVSIGSYLFFDLVLKVNELIANVGAWFLAVGFAYVSNRIWVFRSQVRGRGIWKEALTFYSGRLLTFGLEEMILLVFVTWLQWNSALIKIVAQVIILVGNYLISKLITFRKAGKQS